VPLPEVYFSPMDLPLFVYGSLKPGELAYEQVSDLVADFREATLDSYQLYIRDSLPIIARSSENSKVEGVLLFPKENQREIFWTTVTDYEGTSNYQLEHNLEVTSQGTVYCAAVFVGKKMDKGHPEEMVGPWATRFDRIFGHSFPLLHQAISATTLNFTDAENDPSGYWKQMNGLMANFLLLVTILEHLAAVKFGGVEGDGPSARLKGFQRSPGYLAEFGFLRQKNLIPKILVRDSRNVDKKYSTSSANSAIDAWYQVRSNLQHRGKGSFHDAELVQNACIGLTNLLFATFKTEIEGITEEWSHVTRSELKFAVQENA
jgi:gamma-glutamylcyclotransferase (GGCT)/AIG2-like uncharacterized protein YtfP